jgi:hypothetical protein
MAIIIATPFSLYCHITSFIISLLPNQSRPVAACPLNPSSTSPERSPFITDLSGKKSSTLRLGIVGSVWMPRRGGFASGSMVSKKERARWRAVGVFCESFWW